VWSTDKHTPKTIQVIHNINEIGDLYITVEERPINEETISVVSSFYIDAEDVRKNIEISFSPSPYASISDYEFQVAFTTTQAIPRKILEWAE
jgi:hypothetical protein